MNRSIPLYTKVSSKLERTAQRERSVWKMGGATKFGMVNKTKTWYE